MEWPHKDAAPEREQDAPSRKQRNNRSSHGRTQLDTTTDEHGRMASRRERLAAETTRGPLERSAGRGAGPEVHESGDCLRTDLAIGPRRSRKAQPVTGTEETVSGRIESRPGVCAARPSGRSDEARDRTAHGLATAQRARLPVSGRPETRVQAAL